MKQRPKLHVVTDLTRFAEERAPIPSVHIDRNRITLPGLRFMGQEPHPLQSFDADEHAADLHLDIEVVRS